MRTSACALSVFALQVMKERLRNAIYNCQAIDGDDTFAGMQAAAMGWDWEEEE